MSLDDANRQEMIAKYLDKSNQCWKEACMAKELKAWPMTANRMYYALVNAMRALLLKDRVEAHTHAGMKAKIGQKYVLTGLLSDEQGRLFSQMETMRERADYDCFFDASEENIEEKFLPVENLIARVKELIAM